MGKSSFLGRLWGFCDCTRTSCCTWTSSASVSHHLTCCYLSDITHLAANQFSWNLLMKTCCFKWCEQRLLDSFWWLETWLRLVECNMRPVPSCRDVRLHMDLSHPEWLDIWLGPVLSVLSFEIDPCQLAWVSTWAQLQWHEKEPGLIPSDLRLNGLVRLDSDWFQLT